MSTTVEVITCNNCNRFIVQNMLQIAIQVYKGKDFCDGKCVAEYIDKEVTNDK